MKQKNIKILTFYRFIYINDIYKIKKNLEIIAKSTSILGTVLLANEGVNATISGNNKELDIFINAIKKNLKIRKIIIKESLNNDYPFNKIKIRIKREIVSLGNKTPILKEISGKYIEPKNWDNIIKDKDYYIIDTRNKYEIDIGTFKNSINPQTNSFREFPKYIKSAKIKKTQPIAMFCTGGIRCEKASSYLLSEGYSNIYQLNGGILNYLEYKKNKKTTEWSGECFVFDKRVSVNKSLKKGKYLQCYGCRHPITINDTKSKYFEKGVCCPYCYDRKTSEKKRRLRMRQSQLEVKLKNGNDKTCSK